MIRRRDVRSRRAQRPVCDASRVSRRDLVHVLQALSRGSDGHAGVGVRVADIDDAIGRGQGDMRTALNLESLGDDGLVVQLPDGMWALTPQGIAWLREDRDLSDR